MELISAPEIDTRLSALGPAWRREGDSIVGELQCEDFAAAIELIDRIAVAAEQANHHPDILLHAYRRLTITLATHSAGGITQRDLSLAVAIDALAQA